MYLIDVNVNPTLIYNTYCRHVCCNGWPIGLLLTSNKSVAPLLSLGIQTPGKQNSYQHISISWVRPALCSLHWNLNTRFFKKMMIWAQMPRPSPSPRLISLWQARKTWRSRIQSETWLTVCMTSSHSEWSSTLTWRTPSLIISTLLTLLVESPQLSFKKCSALQRHKVGWGSRPSLRRVTMMVRRELLSHCWSSARTPTTVLRPPPHTTIPTGDLTTGPAPGSTSAGTPTTARDIGLAVDHTG